MNSSGYWDRSSAGHSNSPNTSSIFISHDADAGEEAEHAQDQNLPPPPTLTLTPASASASASTSAPLPARAHAPGSAPVALLALLALLGLLIPLSTTPSADDASLAHVGPYFDITPHPNQHEVQMQPQYTPEEIRCSLGSGVLTDEQASRIHHHNFMQLIEEDEEELDDYYVNGTSRLGAGLLASRVIGDGGDGGDGDDSGDLENNVVDADDPIDASDFNEVDDADDRFNGSFSRIGGLATGITTIVPDTQRSTWEGIMTTEDRRQQLRLMQQTLETYPLQNILTIEEGDEHVNESNIIDGMSSEREVRDNDTDHDMLSHGTTSSVGQEQLERQQQQQQLQHQDHYQQLHHRPLEHEVDDGNEINADESHSQPSLEQVQRVYYTKGLEELESLQLVDLSALATWKLSSFKPGFGLSQLRDDSPETYWQSDGSNGGNNTNPNNSAFTNNHLSNPHSVTIQFIKRVALERISIFTNYSLDESYTPSKIKIMAGSSEGWDLIDVCTVNFNQPIGWSHIIFNGIRNDGVLKCFMVKIFILANHQEGKDSHIRAIRCFGRKHSVPPVKGLQSIGNPYHDYNHNHNNSIPHRVNPELLRDLSIASGSSFNSGILVGNRIISSGSDVRHQTEVDAEVDAEAESLVLLPLLPQFPKQTLNEETTSAMRNVNAALGLNSGFKSIELSSVSSIR